MSDLSRAASAPDAISAPPAEAWLASIVESSFDAIISKDLCSTITSWNRAAERLFGYSAAEAVGRSILMLIPDHLQGEEEDIIGRIRRGEMIETFETMRRRKDGSLVEVSLTVSPIRDGTGAIVGASKIARDISVTRENERRIRLLMAEVNHRVKNQFAVILSMIRETGRQSPDPVVFQQRVKDRIMALSRSHDLLVETEWTGTDLSALITAQLESFEHREQVSLSGPLLALSLWRCSISASPSTNWRPTRRNMARSAGPGAASALRGRSCRSTAAIVSSRYGGANPSRPDTNHRARRARGSAPPS